MALSELNAAIPEKLPVKFAYNELGHRFESVQSKRLVQLLPQGAQPFGPKHTRLIRFNLTATSGDYLLPESVRLQANFNVESTGGKNFKPLGSMGLMFTRMRLICEGVVIQDLNYQDRMHQWLTEDMSKEQYEELCNESFALESTGADGETVHQVIRAGETVRISMPFITLGLFQARMKYLPLRVFPLVMELEFPTEDNTWCDESDDANREPKWHLNDVRLLMTTVQLDNGLDNVLIEAWRKNAIILKMREWNVTYQSIEPAAASNFQLQLLRGMTKCTRIGVSFVGPVNALGEKKVVSLYFPPNVGHTNEKFSWHIQIGTDIKHPIYPVQGIRESYLRARQANCHEAGSRHAYRSDLKRFGGAIKRNATSGAVEEYITADAVRLLMDVEKICHDQADMTGISTLGGVQLTIFLNNMFAGTTARLLTGSPATTANNGGSWALISTPSRSACSCSPRAA